MPLNCFSSSLFLHSYPSLPPPPPLSFPFSSLSLPHFPPCIPSSASIPPCLPTPLHISLSTLFPSQCLPPLSFAPSLPGEWQAHKCSNDSSGGVSVTAIAAVTGAGLSLGANTASAAEPLSPWRETKRKTEREKDDCYHPHHPQQHHSPTWFLSSTKQSPWLYGPVTLPTAYQRHSTLDPEGPQQMDGRDWQ